MWTVTVESVDYDDKYTIPVLTAGKTFILGYTNEKSGIFSQEKLPVIIFDDFTTASKFVDFSFKVKSSAMKILLADKSKTNIKFLFHSMQRIAFTVNEHKRYWISEYSKIKIPLPPLDVQNEIVEQIEVKQNAINHAKEIIKNLERERRYFGQSLRKLKEVEWVKLGEVCEVKSGGTPDTKIKEYYKPPEIPWLKSEACKDSMITSPKTYISKKGLDNSSAKLIHANTAIVALVGATIGKTGYVTFDFCTNQNIASLIPNNDNELDSKFLFLALGMLYDQFVRGDNNYKMANLSFVKNLQIPLPSLEIQKQLVAEAEKEEEIIAANRRLIELMEGKISQVLAGI